MTIKILAIDTSTDACSVALNINHQITERFEIAPRNHAQIILPMIDKVLIDADLKLQNLDAIAFGRGPGSFTGIRIATAIIQGLSLGTGKPVIAISTLRAIAQTAFRESKHPQIFAWLDARMQQIYWGLYEVDAEGIMQHHSTEQVQNRETIILPTGNWFEFSCPPRAYDIALIAAQEYHSGHFLSANEVRPVYLRDEVAKIKGEHEK